MVLIFSSPSDKPCTPIRKGVGLEPTEKSCMGLAALGDQDEAALKGTEMSPRTRDERLRGKLEVHGNKKQES